MSHPPPRRAHETTQAWVIRVTEEARRDERARLTPAPGSQHFAHLAAKHGGSIAKWLVGAILAGFTMAGAHAVQVYQLAEMRKDVASERKHRAVLEQNVIRLCEDRKLGCAQPPPERE